MVGLKNGHILKTLTQSDEPQSLVREWEEEEEEGIWFDPDFLIG